MGVDGVGKALGAKSGVVGERFCHGFGVEGRRWERAFRLGGREMWGSAAGGTGVEGCEVVRYVPGLREGMLAVGGGVMPVLCPPGLGVAAFLFVPCFSPVCVRVGPPPYLFNSS